MAGVTCQVCGESNTEGEALCHRCGSLLAEDGGPTREQPLEPDRPVQADRPVQPDRPASAADTCPACGADVPDAANLVCVECLQPLEPRSPAAPAMQTRREAAELRLLFAGQPVNVPRSGSVLLGRDPDQSPVAALFAARDNVSRRHASIGVEPDGSAWVRDEYSANGTFVNDRQVPGGHAVPLAHGDRLRIASDVIAQVELGRAATT